MKSLESETDPNLIELAGYTLMRLRDPAGVSTLRSRADRETDSALKARLIQFTARLADGDCRLVAWLRNGVGSNEPWRRAGSCLGLLELDRLEGGDQLLAIRNQIPEEVRAWTWNELRRIVEPMMQTTCYEFTWPEGQSVVEQDPTWAGIEVFWKRYATPLLLGDVQDRLDHNDPKWREVDRLTHARERVGRWIN
jgi:hypothetical protein